MKYKSTILLLGVVLIAATIAWLLSGQPTSGDLARKNQRLLPQLEPGGIQSVTIQTQGKTYVCERRHDQKAGRWMMTQPRKVRADTSTVRQIVQTFASATAQTRAIARRASSEPDNDPYGLIKNPLKITFESVSDSRSLTVGKKTGAGDLVYVQRDDSDTVTTGPGALRDALEIRLVDLRAKTLISPVESQELKSFELRFPSRTKAPKILCRRTGRRWKMVSPLVDSANQKTIKTTVDVLASTRLNRGDFFDTDPETSGAEGLSRFDTPDAVIVLKGAQTKQKLALTRMTVDGNTVWMGRYDECESMMRVPSTIYKKITEARQNNGQNFRSPVIANFDTTDAQRILIRHADSTLTIKRNEKTWQIEEYEAPRADGPTINNILKGITTTPVVFTDKPAAPHSELSADAQWNIKIQNASARTLGELSLGEANSADHTYVRRWGYPPILSVPTENWVLALKRGRRALQNHQIASITPAQVRRLELIDDNRHFVFERRDADSPWKMTRPVPGPADDPTINSLLQSLSPLRAGGYASFSAQDPGRYGLDNPSLRLRVISVPESAGKKPRPAKRHTSRGTAPTPGNNQIFALEVGDYHEQYPRGYYAKREKADGPSQVFILPRSIVKQLRSDMGSKQITKVGKLRSLTITADGQSAQFHHDPAENIWRTEEGVAPGGQTKKKLSELTQLLKNFRARKVSAYVISDPAKYGFDDPVLRLRFSDRFTSGKELILGKALPDGSHYVRSAATGYPTVIAPATANKLITVKQTLLDGS